MRIYIAASSDNADRAVEVATELGSKGCTITSTWWTDIAERGQGANPRDADDQQRANWSAKDLSQVADSDALLLLVPNDTASSHGAFLEYGYALGLGKIVAVSGDTLRSIFCALAEEFDTDGEAIDWLVQLADGDLCDPQGLGDKSDD